VRAPTCWTTPGQIYLQRQLGLEAPLYSHVPVLTEADGKKLAKSARSVRLDAADSLPPAAHGFRPFGFYRPAATGARGAFRRLERGLRALE